MTRGVADGLSLDCLSPHLASPSGAGRLIEGAALLALASVAGVLAAGILLATAGEASHLDVLAERPLAVVQAAAGLAVWTAIMAVPGARAWRRLWTRRSVRLHGEAVEICRHTPFGIRRQVVPLAAYRGIAHRVRTSLSGVTNEVVLVHPDRRLSVTLASAERLPHGLFDELKSLFKLPEISARAIDEATPVAPVPVAAATLSAARA
jgi:hypothetical protein